MNIEFRVNERSRHQIVFNFTDAAGEPSDPPAEYRIDTDGGAQVRAPTALTVTGGAATVDLTPDDNAILNAMNAEEVRVVTVTANPGTDQEYNQAVYYAIVNLAFVD